MAQRTVLVRYFGRVQGVGFRATTRALAQAFQLKGWVKNEPGGSVQLIVTAEEAEIEAFLKAIRSSRLGGYIDREEEESSVNVGELKGFDIQY
jgi:acylphosphatase